MRSWLVGLFVVFACGRDATPREEPRTEPAPDPALAEALAKRGPSYQPRTRHKRPDGTPRYTNRLILETSPYLLQHAHNPVDWYPWGDAAFEKARREDKPIFLSIGYSTCHWCHVMEEESFEDEAIAALLNRHFVAIKVDREERPDLDAMYLAAVQRLTGSGGWPLTVVLLPDRRAFFGGTYFPPRDGQRGATVGLATLLPRLAQEYAASREAVVARAGALVAELQRTAAPAGGAVPDVSAMSVATQQLAAQFDATWGGFGRAPKFPRPAVLAMLLREHRRTGDARALELATRTLERMAAGGVYDQVGRGFHRYTVDDKWRVPHFEKMLYDNAQLALVYLEAAQATGRADFADVARETLELIVDEFAVGDAFASAIDADSARPDGAVEEGAYYVWTAAELERVLGADLARVVRESFDVTIGGNFEGGTNILWRPQPLAEVAARLRLAPDEVRAAIAKARPLLREARAKRPRPHTDRKILVDWNGLAISALARGALVLDEPRFRDAAQRAAAYLLRAARAPDGALAHGIAEGRAFGRAFLDDHAFLAAGLLDLFEADADPRWLREAVALHRALDAGFADAAGGYFFTATHHEPLAVRDKPGADEALPAGNSVAATTLLRLYALTSDERYRTAAEGILRAFAPTLARAPTLLPALLVALDAFAGEPKQIVLVSPKGTEPAALLATLRAAFVPHRVLVRVVDGEPPPAELAELVEGKRALGGKPTAYVCLGTRCKRPTSDPAVLAEQLR